MPQTPQSATAEHPLVVEAQRLAAADELLAADRANMEAAVRGRHRTVIAAWNAGHSENHIAKKLGVSRTPVHDILVKADASGELRRPLAPPRGR